MNSTQDTLTQQQINDIRSCLTAWSNNSPPDQQKIQQVQSFLTHAEQNLRPPLQKVG